MYSSTLIHDLNRSLRKTCFEFDFVYNNNKVMVKHSMKYIGQKWLIDNDSNLSRQQDYLLLSRYRRHEEKY